MGDLKKFSKQIQAEAEQNKAREKSELLSKVNSYRKGLLDSLDFLSAPNVKGGGNKRRAEGKVNEKRKWRDEKYGMGGKNKRFKKQNTEESYQSYGSKGGRKSGGQRLGKNRRQKMKSKNKK